MQEFDINDLKKLYIPVPSSHKAQNGKLLIIGGSHLFHAASLWALTIASRVVDMVFYSSVVENNQIVHELKKEFRNGIIVPREDIDNYAEEADAILIGPGMMRTKENEKLKAKSEKEVDIIKSLTEITQLEDEGEQSYYLTKYLLEKYPEKKWVIDAGALQMMNPEWLLQLQGNVVITPHPLEFERVKQKVKDEKCKIAFQNENLERELEAFSKVYNCIVLLKGQEDIVYSPTQCIKIAGGNAGMTKGGTGDVLAGLVAALACKNDLWLAATAGSYFNKKAGESLFERVGYYFNASDLADEIPRVMKDLI